VVGREGVTPLLSLRIHPSVPIFIDRFNAYGKNKIPKFGYEKFLEKLGTPAGRLLVGLAYGFCVQSPNHYFGRRGALPRIKAKTAQVKRSQSA
jgi:hypothetical protein